MIPLTINLRIKEKEITVEDRIKALRKRFPNSLKNEINQIINNNNKESIDDLVTNQEIIALVQSYIEKETEFEEIIKNRREAVFL